MFGKWTTLEAENEHAYILCKCLCGTVKEVSKRNLLSGDSRLNITNGLY